MPTTTPSVQPRELVAELMAHTRWSAERLEAHQRERPDALLRHAVTVPPFVVPGYPSLIAAVAQEQLVGRLHIAPRIVAYAGEVLTADMRAQITAAWGVEPFSMYSTPRPG